MRAFVVGVGLIGPGLNGWPAARPVLAGAAPYRHAATTIPPDELLPPAERRRTGAAVRLALAAGHEAMEQAEIDAASVATVFTSSSSDGDNLHAICESLARPTPEISPTRFHNSVHNAAAGYWGIATRSLERSTSLACFDGSFAAGLLEAVTQTSVDRAPVGLIAYDMPYPEPLSAVRRIAGSFGVALVLSPERAGRTLAQIDVAAVSARAGASTMPDQALEALRTGVPAARSLPILAALARGAREALAIDYLEGLQLQVSVMPCD
jgi:hypothetical protein